MKIFSVLIFQLFFVILIASCVAESEYIANLPKIDGFEVKKVYRTISLYYQKLLNPFSGIQE